MPRWARQAALGLRRRRVGVHGCGPPCLLISAAVVGAIIGGLARLVLPGRQEIGILTTIIIGWIGSLFGSLIGRHLFHVGSFLTVLCEIAVAAVLVLIASSGAGNALARRNDKLRW